MTHTEVSKSSSAKERLLQLIQLTEIQQHSDSSLTQSQSLLSGKVVPSSRGSRAVRALLRFALSLSAWLTFLDAACVRSRLAPGNCTERSEPFTSPSGALLATLVAILGMILCVNGELLLLGSRNRQGIYKEGQHISIGKSSRKSPFQEPAGKQFRAPCSHLQHTQWLMRHCSCTYKIASLVLFIYITDWALCHWLRSGKTRLSPRYKIEDCWHQKIMYLCRLTSNDYGLNLMSNVFGAAISR